MKSAAFKLELIKIVHTIAWAFFVSCILAIWVFTSIGRIRCALFFICIVLGEVIVLILNRWRCPLTSLAARYTEERQDNFDIYLPMWLARHNKLIFGTLYVAGIIFTLLMSNL